MSKTVVPFNMLSPGANLAAYVQNVSTIPVLSPEEEKALADDLYYNENVDAARQLVLAHLRFVVHIARSYSGYGLSESDLIQEGNVGLMKAVKRFDPERGVRLVSFAVHWIKAEIHEFVIRNWRIVKIATTKPQRKLFFNLRKNKKRLAWLSPEETQAVADDLGVSVKDVAQMEGRLFSSDMSFELPASDDTDTAYMAPVNMLADSSQDPALLLEDMSAEQDSRDELTLAIHGLDERSRDIVQQRWLQDKKATLHDLAAKYDISAERVRQLEANAMKKMRKQMRTMEA